MQIVGTEDEYKERVVLRISGSGAGEGSDGLGREGRRRTCLKERGRMNGCAGRGQNSKCYANKAFKRKKYETTDRTSGVSYESFVHFALRRVP